MNLVGFFGIGLLELLILGGLVVGVIAVVVVLIVLVGVSRKPGQPPRPYVDALERENDELRDKNERLKRGQD